jgi:hypothetical protein
MNQAPPSNNEMQLTRSAPVTVAAALAADLGVFDGRLSCGGPVEVR